MRNLRGAMALALLLIVAGACSGGGPSPAIDASSASASATTTPTLDAGSPSDDTADLTSSEATDTASPSPTDTATPTAAPTPTPKPTAKPTPKPTPKPTTAAVCTVFPYSNVWNKAVSGLGVAGNSAAMIDAIGAGSYLHPDFDAVGDGIPYNVVSSSTPSYKVSFEYADESDAGPYPIPSSPKIEGGSDRHLISVDPGRCMLWELYAVQKSGSSWSAGSGAVWNLRSNALRPEGWTSADAAGLPIYPGLVKYSEVMSGEIDHALRFTAPKTCGYIYPARHLTAPTCSNLPPMGLRVRLKASVDISGFGPHAQVVLKALKKYGMILADNGSPWYVSGAPDSRWNDDEFHKLQTLHGSDFEVVNTGSLRNG